MISSKAHDSSAREDLDDQLKNLQKQLEDDMKKQKEVIMIILITQLI